MYAGHILTKGLQGERNITQHTQGNIVSPHTYVGLIQTKGLQGESNTTHTHTQLGSQHVVL